MLKRTIRVVNMSASQEKLNQIVKAIDEIIEDYTVPKNVKRNLENAKNALLTEDEVSIRVNKALNELDELSEDTNMQSYTRTQVWNIVSMLETI